MILFGVTEPQTVEESMLVVMKQAMAPKNGNCYQVLITITECCLFPNDDEDGDATRSRMKRVVVAEGSSGESCL